MINAKALYNTILSDTRLTDVVTVFDAYPSTVETFPCVCFIDESQNDIEFADNQPLANNLTVQIHIFTKALSGYATTTEIAILVNTLMREKDFYCSANSELQDVDADVRHRVLTYRNFCF